MQSQSPVGTAGAAAIGSTVDAGAIAKVREAWLRALNSNDLDGLIAPLTADTMIFPPHEPPRHGVDAVRAWHEARIGQFSSRGEISTIELIEAADCVIDLFSYTLTLKPNGGGDLVSDHGNCIWVWRRDGPSWKIARAIWSSTQPLPGSH